jgi:transcriptional regulator with XRE-family HTH domain
MVTIGEKIQELRQSRGMTQKRLSELIGTNNSVISNWEAERIEPTLFNCILLADVFGISLDELACRDFKEEK